MKMQDIATESYATAQEKGWWDDSVPRDEEMLHFLMISELSEALEDFRAHKGVTESWLENGSKPCGIPSEAADLIIRIGDLSGKKGIDFSLYPDLGADLNAAIAIAPVPVMVPIWRTQPKEFGGAMMRATSRVCFVNDTFLHADEVAYAYWRICNDIVWFFDQQGYDLRVMIQQKMDFNKTRPIRHGNKKV